LKIHQLHPGITMGIITPPGTATPIYGYETPPQGNNHQNGPPIASPLSPILQHNPNNESPPPVRALPRRQLRFPIGPTPSNIQSDPQLQGELRAYGIWVPANLRSSSHIISHRSDEVEEELETSNANENLMLDPEELAVRTADIEKTRQILLKCLAGHNGDDNKRRRLD
jgi:hypothetical protein